ncbi:hypothetical protein OAS19_01985 [Altererythrobacter sp.]|nr:hypothetical protein [Altererythrobacter sp.]
MMRLDTWAVMNVTTEDGKIERAARKVVGVEGRYRTGSGQPRDVWITDLSQSGCRFYDRFGTMQEGKAITLRIGTVGPIAAHVRWWDNHTNGVQFETPLHESVFDHIVANMSEHVPPNLQTGD